MLTPLIFRPLYRRYIWGGRNFARVFTRNLPPGDDYAESWELVDRGDDQSVVAAGPWAGRSLGELVREHGGDLLGARGAAGRFPLLFKFLDACRDLSVQVHPDDTRAARLDPPDLGKTEAWYVVAAEPGSRIFAGLRPGVDKDDLAEALQSGRCETVLHSFVASPGDCVFIPAGTVHAIGAGLLVAEIQQSSDVTYRLHDWNRTGPDGRPRPLHIAAGLEAVTRTGPVEPITPIPTSDRAVRRLVTCPYFQLDDVRPGDSWSVGGDGGWHFLAVLEGRVSCSASWGLPPLGAGECLLLPAAVGRETLQASPVDGRACRLLRVGIPT